MIPRRRRHAILVSFVAAISVAAAAGEAPSLEIKMASGCRLRAFVAAASGAERLDAGGGKLALVGLWKPIKLRIMGHRRLESAYVYDLSERNGFGGYSSRRRASTPQVDLLEVTMEVDVPSGARAVDLSGLDFKVTGASLATILGFDTMRSVEVSDDFVSLDKGLCLAENDGSSRAKYTATLNATAPPSTVVYLDDGATRPLPLRILVAVPAGTKSMSISQR
jgi:hypothetical protein